MKTRLMGFALLGLGFFAGSAAAAQSAGELLLPYSPTGSITLGDAIDIDAPFASVGRCVTYQKDDLKWDTGGAVNSDGTIEINSDYNRRKRDDDITLGLKTTADVKAGVFSGKATTDASYHRNTVREDEDRLTTISFRATADYGRLLIENYAPISGMADPSSSAFRRKCGTHFVRGQHRISELAILVEITSASHTGKDALDASLTQTFGGGGGTKVVTANGSTELKATYKSIIDFAQTAGKVRIDYRALGGPGIKAAGASAKLVDPKDFDKLAQIVSGVADDFDQNNSSVTGYVLQSNTALGAPPPAFDMDRIEHVGELTRYLIRAQQAHERYSDINAHDPKIYQQYFMKQDMELTSLVASLIERIKTCANGGECAELGDDLLSHFSFLEDLFDNAKLSVTCTYRPAKTLLPNVQATDNPDVLESMSVILSAEMPRYEIIDMTSVRLSRLDSKAHLEDLRSSFSGFAVSSPNTKGVRRVFGTIYEKNLRPADLVSVNAVDHKFKVDDVGLVDRREDVLGSMFSVSAMGPAGIRASYSSGFPPRDNCPVLR